MGYKEVKVQGRGGSKGPMISIRKSGTIGINSEALNKYFKDEHTHAKMYHDEPNDKLGIRPLTEDEKDELDNVLTLTRSNSGGSVAPTSFLKTEGLKPRVTTQYEPFEDSLNGNITLISIDLMDEIGTYGSPDEDDQEDTAEQDEQEEAVEAEQ